MSYKMINIIDKVTFEIVKQNSLKIVDANTLSNVQKVV